MKSLLRKICLIPVLYCTLINSAFGTTINGTDINYASIGLKVSYNIEPLFFSNKSELQTKKLPGYGVLYRYFLKTSFYKKNSYIKSWYSDTSLETTPFKHINKSIQLLQLHQTINKQMTLYKKLHFNIGFGPSLLIPIKEISQPSVQPNDLNIEFGAQIKIGLRQNISDHFSINVDLSRWRGFNTEKLHGLGINSYLTYKLK